MKKILGKTEDVLLYVAMGSCLLIFIYTTLDIFGRKFFAHPMIGAVEVSSASMVGIVFLSLAVSQRMGGQIRVDFFLDRISAKARWWMETVVYAVSFLVFCFWIWFTMINAIRSASIAETTFSTVVQIPIYPGKIAIVVGIVALTIRTLLQLIAHIQGAREGVYPKEEAIVREVV